MASNRDWDLATYSNLTALRGDAGYYLSTTYHPTGGLNFSGTEEPELTTTINSIVAYNEYKVTNWVTTRSEYYMISN
ncbi:hypothetical protein [Bacillus sp. CH30_1T]|uniref:hypothetical protein n=1 Tax=Bacillus sp. CH30_1T TaxID=2604836 RepID=UPI00292D34B9|nr:hypothetical protein [Bacillus sp. CH30_1T]